MSPGSKDLAEKGVFEAQVEWVNANFITEDTNAMLEMGASKPWPDAMEAFTRGRTCGW